MRQALYGNGFFRREFGRHQPRRLPARLLRLRLRAARGRGPLRAPRLLVAEADLGLRRPACRSTSGSGRASTARRWSRRSTRAPTSARIDRDLSADSAACAAVAEAGGAVGPLRRGPLLRHRRHRAAARPRSRWRGWSEPRAARARCACSRAPADQLARDLSSARRREPAGPAAPLPRRAAHDPPRRRLLHLAGGDEALEPAERVAGRRGGARRGGGPLARRVRRIRARRCARPGSASSGTSSTTTSPAPASPRRTPSPGTTRRIAENRFAAIAGRRGRRRSRARLDTRGAGRAGRGLQPALDRARGRRRGAILPWPETPAPGMAPYRWGRPPGLPGSARSGIAVPAGVAAPVAPTGRGRTIRVFDPDGEEVPAQVLGGDEDGLRVAFLARVPVGRVRGLRPAARRRGGPARDRRLPRLRRPRDLARRARASWRTSATACASTPTATSPRSSTGPNGRELLRAPLRLQLIDDEPAQWPAWEIDYEDLMAAPRAVVRRSGAGPGPGDGPGSSRARGDAPRRAARPSSR